MTHRSPLNPFAKFPEGPAYYTFWEDFDDELALTSNLPVAASSRWIGTALNSGTFAQTTDEQFGVAVLSGAGTTDNSGAQIQTDMEQFALVASKVTGFMTRLKMGDGTQDEFFAGLSITDPTLIDGGGTLAVADITASDCVGFYKPDGETTCYGIVIRDSVLVATGAIPLTGTSYNVFGWEANMSATAGTGTIIYYLNGYEAGRITSSTLPYDGEEILAPSLAFLSGVNTGTKTLTVDYIGAFMQR